MSKAEKSSNDCQPSMINQALHDEQNVTGKPNLDEG